MLFNISKFETATRKFAREILTDGKTVSVILRKPRHITFRRDLRESDFDLMWGLDPGRRDLFVATNPSGEKLSCSSREFYEDARYTRSNKTMQGWRNRNPFVDQSFAGMPTKKIASLEKLKVYTTYVIPRLDRLVEFERVKPYRKLRFRRYKLAKKKLRELCLRLTAVGGHRTLVGFGDWSNGDNIKRHPKGPVKALERELKRHCTVESIDEFRTSKLHANCQRELSKQFSLQKCRDGIVRTRKAYSVLHCRNNGCFGTTVNRDENASRNMLLLLQHRLHGHRPREFCRAP